MVADNQAVKTTSQINNVPGEVEPEPQAPPKPLKLERKTNAKRKKAYCRKVLEEALSEPEHEVDEYDRVVNEPALSASPVGMKPLTRVDKLRMLARSVLP